MKHASAFYYVFGLAIVLLVLISVAWLLVNCSVGQNTSCYVFVDHSFESLFGVSELDTFLSESAVALFTTKGNISYWNQSAENNRSGAFGLSLCWISEGSASAPCSVWTRRSGATQPLKPCESWKSVLNGLFILSDGIHCLYPLWTFNNKMFFFVCLQWCFFFFFFLFHF